MNGCLPDWNMEDDFRHGLPVTNEKMCSGANNELIELLKRNRHVVLHSQTNCSATPAIFESRQAQKPESLLKCGDSIVNSSDFIVEEETSSWFQYPLDNSIEKDFSDFFYGMPTVEPIYTEKSMKENSNACAKQFSFDPHENVMLPQKSCLDKPGKADLILEKRKETLTNEAVVGMGDLSSMRKILSSVCGNNKAQNIVEVSHASSNVKGVKDSSRSTLNCLQAKTYESAISSSSGGSRRSTTNHGLKRKRRDAEESEGHSELAEYESAEASKPAQRRASGRRSRSAEVHNLSERRRRDKINEKMRALQELIPHCNKSDKASMLDEAIEYLKSLQLQLQVMWMGNGMAPMLFPSIQQYMSRMGIEMNHHSTASIPNPVQLQRAPSDVQPTMPGISIPNQPPACTFQGPNSINFAAQMHNFHLPEQYSSYLGFPQMQMPPQVSEFESFRTFCNHWHECDALALLQVMNMCTYETQMMQQNQLVAAVDKQRHTNNKSST